MRRALLIVTVLAAAAGVEARTRTVRHLGDCTAILGIANAGIAYDEGDRMVTNPFERVPNVNGDMMLLSDGRTLLATQGREVFRSRDDGCSWIPFGTTFFGTFELHAAAGGRAYATEVCCTEDVSVIYRIDEGGIVRLLMPKDDLAGLGADPANPDRVRAAFDVGHAVEIWESLDGGEHWQQTSAFICRDGCMPDLWKMAYFDPADLEHIVVATNGTIGVHTTRDGGRTWTPASGLLTYGTHLGVTSVTFGSADILWAVVVQRTLEDSRRAIYRSVDGGSTFRFEVDDRNGVAISGGTSVTPSRTNPDVGWFGAGAFGATWFQRYDASTRTIVVREQSLGFDGIHAIVQSPRDPETLHVMYRGPHCEFCED